MKNERIILCLTCTTKWHMKNPAIYIKHLSQCPMCLEDKDIAKNIKSKLKLRKVRTDKKTLLQHRKTNRVRQARWRLKQQSNKN